MDNHELHDIDGLGITPEELEHLKSMGLDPNASLSGILKSILDPDAADTPAEQPSEPAAQAPQEMPEASTSPAEAPVPEPERPMLDLDAYSDLDTYSDSGEYRTYSGNREYRSFDASLPDASPDEWYHYSDEDMELDEEDDGDYEEELPAKPAKKRRHPVLSIIAHMLLVIVTALAAVYLVAIYSDIPIIAKARTMYIQTAMSTLSHKWMATAIIPSEMIDDVMRMQYEFDNSMVGVKSDEGWGQEISELPTFSQAIIGSSDEPAEVVETQKPNQDNTSQYSSPDEELFYQIFWELDYDSMSDYLAEHPDVLSNGWAGININEAGLDDDGTSIKTIYGDQVLAVNAADGIVLIRIYLPSGLGYADSRGILAIAKDTSRLSLCPADTLGVIGQTTGRICEANDGILAINGSAFLDDGGGNGGQLSGNAVCSGDVIQGEVFLTEPGSKRIEVRDDNRMYIVDTIDSIGSDVREAAEFRPALIVDGKITVDESCGWTSPNPRTVLGQSSKMETMMVVVEGRFTDSPGCSVVEIAELMLQYGCVQALNLDGGTSAMMYYDGEYVNRCSNTNLPGGRTVPTAWVYR